MNVASTQVASYRTVRANLTDLTQQQKIVMFLDDNGPHIKDKIAESLGMRHSSVTARLNELVKTGEVVEQDLRWNPLTKRHVTVYALG